ncbi:DMT family transporter [Neogemmobacter tilapiae]|uniref:Membrane protein n=1 Tax=Neogemmobacter tilapiae TaxID=875041 RepID=A0A918WJD9_9RHOB|nr:DMT family transporter [Gemmobacter tilapiae]GHC57129.1 membrane protein [Gemmobacter tilapiae]
MNLLSDNLRGILLMNLAMLVFTLNDTAMKAVMQTMPLFQAITLRGIVTTAGLLIMALVMRQLVLLPPGRDMGIMTLRTAAEVAATLTFLTALQHMDLANLSAIMQSLPLVVTLAAALIFKERIGWRRLSAILVGFVGVILIIQPGTSGFTVWSLLGLASVLTVMVRDLAARGVSSAVPSLTVALWASLAVTIMGGIGILFEQPVALTGWNALLLLAAAANLIIGYLTVVMVMRAGDIGLIAPFRYMSLIWALIAGWLLFNSLPDALTLIGATIVVGSGIFTLLRERHLKRAARA